MIGGKRLCLRAKATHLVGHLPPLSRPDMKLSKKETKAEETTAVKHIPPTDPSAQAEAKENPTFRRP
jgi:hypothetical protein